MPNIPKKDKRILSDHPIFNEELNMWSFDQPFFIIDDKRVEIISTQRIENSRDVTHTLKTQSGKVFDMKMSEIISQFYLLKKEKERVDIKLKQVKQINQTNLNF